MYEWGHYLYIIRCASPADAPADFLQNYLQCSVRKNSASNILVCVDKYRVGEMTVKSAQCLMNVKYLFDENSIKITLSESNPKCGKKGLKKMIEQIW
jgi:hypothetical protein